MKKPSMFEHVFDDDPLVVQLRGALRDKGYKAQPVRGRQLANGSVMVRQVWRKKDVIERVVISARIRPLVVV